ncbi:alpha/beta hydrolase [Phototrophicus methaneseepsis]|uniref:Alpha/beta hydrolase n=1 Tax=Phototrophicus methaneseepsis TaxID=2710758 RepID=A0A7S8E882_9CHLR|nr:alpha/beta hydrolase [Phototrophicus methaneseepsis]QPC82195.1 alpha/beta hydrolase [Phototrophicus methaneseepsis]
MSATIIGDDLIHYERLGRGRPVVLLHGWIGSWRYWIPLMQQLHLKYTVYTIDLVGFGDSTKDPSSYSLESHVAMLDAFMEKIGIPKVALIGHGLGAMVAARFALNFPTRVARLLLTSVPLFDPGDLSERTPAGKRVLLTNRDRYSLSPHMDEAHGSEETIVSNPFQQQTIPSRGALSEPTVPNQQEIAARARAMANVSANRRNELKDLFNDKSLDDLLARCFKRTEPEYDKLKVDVDKADDRALQASVTHFDSGRMLDDLRQITAPLALVHGEDDPILPVPDEAIWQYLTVGKEDMCVPMSLANVRHFPMLEHESFPRLTMDFLEAVDLSKLELRERWRRRSR